MFGVFFHREENWEQDQWSFLFSNFGITEIWEHGGSRGDLEIYQPTIVINDASELPADRPLVVLAPLEGRYIQGNESLVDFVHPNDAIYMFGASHLNLNEDDFNGVVPDHKVYIPTVECELYSHAAAYITIFDRVAKAARLNNG